MAECRSAPLCCNHGGPGEKVKQKGVIRRKRWRETGILLTTEESRECSNTSEYFHSCDACVWETNVNWKDTAVNHRR